jgi:putative oxidoreductase
MNFSIIPARFSPYLLSLLRVASGLAFLEHGTGKILNFPPIHEKMLAMLGSGMLYFTGLVELICGLLITFGLLTRPAAFFASGFMAFGYFMAHAPHSFYPAVNGGEAALLYCFAFLYISCAGAGPISLDALLGANAGARSSSSRGAAAA